MCVEVLALEYIEGRHSYAHMYIMAISCVHGGVNIGVPVLITADFLHIFLWPNMDADVIRHSTNNILYSGKLW